MGVDFVVDYWYVLVGNECQDCLCQFWWCVGCDDYVVIFGLVFGEYGQCLWQQFGVQFGFMFEYVGVDYVVEFVCVVQVECGDLYIY